jgi:hypothetical protein
MVAGGTAGAPPGVVSLGPMVLRLGLTFAAFAGPARGTRELVQIIPGSGDAEEAVWDECR